MTNRDGYQGLDRSHVAARLTALWGLTEAGLGGVIHALRIPFTGILVGSTAVILITLIAASQPRRKVASVLLRAMMVVLVIKATVSPHTPIPAYLAVLFQGVLGALLFTVLPSITLAAMLLGVFALLEGILQKFLVMTLLFGAPLWEAIDLFGDQVLFRLGISSAGFQARWLLIGCYLVYYGLGGIVVGWTAGRVPGKLRQFLCDKTQRDTMYSAKLGPNLDVLPNGRRHWSRRRLIPALLLFGFVSGMLLLSGGSPAGMHPVLYVAVRSCVVVMIWFLIVGPVLRRLIARWQHRGVAQQDVQDALAQFPALKQAAVCAWRNARQVKGLRRWQTFILHMVAGALLVDAPE